MELSQEKGALTRLPICRLPAPQVARFAQHCRSLTAVNFACCNNITDHALLALGANVQLASANFSGCGQITDKGVRCLAQNCPDLTTVAFAGCELLTDEACSSLADGSALFVLR